MCGGEMYMVPCSHFGHMFRSENPTFKNPRPYDYITRNYKRVIEVWMDEYKHYVYERDPQTWALDAGLLLRQHALREKLQCKSFKWYLDNVAPEILQKFPVKGAPWFARGWVRNLGAKTLCIDTMNEDHMIGLYPCDGTRVHPNYNQRFELSFYRDIAHYGTLEADCIQPLERRPGARLIKSECTQKQGEQFWKYERVSGFSELLEQIKTISFQFQTTKMLWNDVNGDFCMECSPIKQTLFLNRCNASNVFQKWEWGALNRTMLDNWETMGNKLV
jgi:polypeptide N-acetylgalactosaminyltransferase